MQETFDTPASRVLTYAGVWFAVLAWGTSFVAARFLLHPEKPGQATLSPLVLAAARFSIASLFFVVPLARALLHRQITRRDLLRMVVLGQLTFSLYFWLQYTGVQQTNASISSILVVGLIPVVTALLAQLLGKERLSWMTLSALLLGFVGVAFIVFQKPLSISLASGFLLGVFCLVGNAFAFAAYSTLSKRWMQRISPPHCEIAAARSSPRSWIRKSLPGLATSTRLKPYGVRRSVRARSHHRCRSNDSHDWSARFEMC